MILTAGSTGPASKSKRRHQWWRLFFAQALARRLTLNRRRNNDEGTAPPRQQFFLPDHQGSNFFQPFSLSDSPGSPSTRAEAIPAVPGDSRSSS